VLLIPSLSAYLLLLKIFQNAPVRQLRLFHRQKMPGMGNQLAPHVRYQPGGALHGGVRIVEQFLLANNQQFSLQGSGQALLPHKMAPASSACRRGSRFRMLVMYQINIPRPIANKVPKITTCGILAA
jgi:hypothetical protein